MNYLSPDILAQLIDLLAPIFPLTAEARRTELMRAIGNQAVIYDINFEGTHNGFLSGLIKQMHAVQDSAGDSMLITILRYARIQQGNNHAEPIDALIGQLRHHARQPIDEDVVCHCRRMAKEIHEKEPEVDYFIQEDARLLPIYASPYQDGVFKGQPENLLSVMRRMSRLLVLGEPGMGKTLVLKRLALELATSYPPIVPIFINLSTYDGEPLLKWIWRSLISTGQIDLHSPREARHFLNRQNIRCYIMLDGLNEISPQHHHQAISEIAKLDQEFSHQQIVVTSRAKDENWRTLQAAVIQTCFLIQPITTTNAQSYLTRHLGIRERDKLWNKLDPKMRELTSTPLLLALLKDEWIEERAHDELPQMPRNRGELYRKIVVKMLRRDTNRIYTAGVSEPIRLSALEKIALHMNERKTFVIKRDEAISIVEDEAILTAILANGFMKGDSRLSFSPHLTMQEHFAARAMMHSLTQNSKRQTSTGRLLRILGLSRPQIQHAADSWWSETFIQMAGLVDDATLMAETIAEVNPWLALWCLEEGGRADLQTREIIHKQSVAMIYSPVISDRRRAAQTLTKLQTSRAAEPLAILSFDSDLSVVSNALNGLLNLDNTDTTLLNNALVTKSSIERAQWGRRIAEIDPRPGVGLNANGLPEIVWCEVPAGEFICGLNRLAFADKCYMAKYPVTIRQFQAFADASDGFGNSHWWHGLSRPTSQPKEPNSKYRNHPRDNVSWYDAMAFCRWLNHQLKSGRLKVPSSAPADYGIRLPTEVEWEKSARGMDGRKFPYGNSFDPTKGNTNDTGIGTTTAVGMFPDGASPFGVLDLAGNVNEWTLGMDRSISIGGSYRRIVRGGSWDNHPFDCSATSWQTSTPRFRGGHVGFRIVYAPSVVDF